MGLERNRLLTSPLVACVNIMQLKTMAWRVATLLVVAVLSGCNSSINAGVTAPTQQTVRESESTVTTSDRPWADSPWAVMFDEGLEEGTDFTRAILADGVVTSAEHLAAQEHAVQCMQMAGIEVYLDFEFVASDPLGRPEILTYEGTPEQETVKFECLMELNHVYWLYNYLNLNPNNEDWSSLIAACLVRNGLVPDGFTGRDWDEVAFRNSNAVIDGRTYFGGVPAEEYPYARQELDENGELQWVLDEPEDYVPEPVLLPGGVDIMSPEARQCEFDPRS